MDFPIPTTTKVAGVGAVAALGAAVAFGAGPGAASAHDLAARGQSSAIAEAPAASGKVNSPELRAAREKARQLEGKQRREAFAKIREDVKSGKYGSEAKKAAERRAERREKLAERLPATLRNDLKEMKGLEGEKRTAARKEIRDNARDGDYGKKIGRLAKLFSEEKN